MNIGVAIYVHFMSSAHEFLTVKECAAIARVHINTVYRWLKNTRRAPAFSRVTRSYRISSADFYAWMKRRK